MKTPFCSVCIRSNVLCNPCEKKAHETTGKHDLDISKHLINLYPNLEAEYLSSYSTNSTTILFMNGAVGKVVGVGGKGAMKLSKLLHKRVKIINLGSDLRTIVSEILYPVKLVGINTLFRDGMELFRVRVSRTNSRNIPFDRKDLEKVISKVTEKNVRLVFE